jgi:hypothetical protein
MQTMLARIGTLVSCLIMAIAVTSCGVASAPVGSASPVAAITIGPDLTQINVCQVIPAADMEAVMGRKLAAPPRPFVYYDAPGSSGCWYEAAWDSSGAAHFGYVAFTHLGIYKGQPLYMNRDVNGLGQEAYFNTGPDARQLWVKVADDAAIVVALGDAPNEAGDLQIAQLILAAIK